MLTIENTLQTAVVGSEDGRYTYEVKRSWGEVRIINLYSIVFSSRPSVKDLKSDIENTAYIRAIFEEQEVKEYDIVIAWGSCSPTH